jgi:Na+-transporting methylmalonyl-CoA/oxaloacetate decarboxylase gamma subunit
MGKTHGVFEVLESSKRVLYSDLRLRLVGIVLVFSFLFLLIIDRVM